MIVVLADSADSSAKPEVIFRGGQMNRFAVAFPTFRTKRHFISGLEIITMWPTHLHLLPFCAFFFKGEIFLLQLKHLRL